DVGDARQRVEGDKLAHVAGKASGGEVDVVPIVRLAVVNDEGVVYVDLGGRLADVDAEGPGGVVAVLATGSPVVIGRAVEGPGDRMEAGVHIARAEVQEAAQVLAVNAGR